MMLDEETRLGAKRNRKFNFRKVIFVAGDPEAMAENNANILL
jgi:hypothetical protein